MERLLPLTPEQLRIAEERLRNPAPGSKTAAAKEYGIDLTLLIRQRRFSPEERVLDMHQGACQIEQIRGAARRK